MVLLDTEIREVILFWVVKWGECWELCVLVVGALDEGIGAGYNRVIPGS